MSFNIFEAAKAKNPTNKTNVFADFLKDKGLYAKIAITIDNYADWLSLLNGDVRIQSYCTECKESSVFTMKPIRIVKENHHGEKVEVALAEYLQSLNPGIKPANPTPANVPEKWRWYTDYVGDSHVFTFSFQCAMNPNHRIDFIVSTDVSTVRKIGQYPSVADLTFPELDVYKKVLSEVDRKEFGRAIGLYASGIGAGSYVYLRRIFERLLMQAKENAGDTIDTDTFNKAHVDTKITLLSDYLPETLTSNPTLYGILSKGIHELSEEECIAYFPVVKECIYMILNEWEDMRKKAEQTKAISSALSKIATNITT